MKYAILLGLFCVGGCATVAEPLCGGPGQGPVSDAAADQPVPPMLPVPDRIMVWDDLLSRAKPVPDATVRYGADALQVVDVWRPSTGSGQGGAGSHPAPHPAVLMIHGGCWQTAIAERDIMNWIADDLRKAGVGVWNIEYRGVDRGGGYPGTYEDVAAAADLFAASRGEYGFRTDAPVVVIGHSAGGHLALWLARQSGTRLKVDLAISQGGLPDLRAQTKLPDHPCGADAAIKMAGGEFARTSPPEMPKGSARELQFNNDLDRIAPPSFGAAYGAEMVTTPHEGHVELIAPGSVSWDKQRAAILKAFGL